MQTAINQTTEASDQQVSPLKDKIGTQERRLRIVHIVSSLKVGGMEHFVLRIAAAQQRNGHDVVILALQDGPLREVAGPLGLRTRVLGGARKLPRAAKAAIFLARFRPDLAHAHNQTSLHYAVLAKRVSGARVVMTNHGQGTGSSRTPGVEEWGATDAVVTVARAVAERMDSTALGSRLSTIYNGVDVTPARCRRREVREELNLTEGRVVGAMVARMDGLKGHDTLLHALARLQREEVPVTILIVGDGAERMNIERLATELKLSNAHVRFLGFRADVADLLAASDFFTLPSLTEGLPLSILEAMTHSLATVATQVGGIPELIENGRHGLLVTVQDAQALAKAIALLVQDPQHRRAFGKAAYERVREEFSFEQMTQQYEDLYFSVCAKARMENR